MIIIINEKGGKPQGRYNTIVFRVQVEFSSTWKKIITNTEEKTFSLSIVLLSYIVYINRLHKLQEPCSRKEIVRSHVNFDI